MLSATLEILVKRDISLDDLSTRRRRPADWVRARLVDIRRVPATVWIPTGVALLALGICCYQLSLPFVMLGIHGYSGIGYDDGVYLGAATRLVHGVLPYRDFDFAQPPGITLVMGPVALLGRLIGTRDAMAVARCVTAAVTGLNAALAALVMRDRGKVAMLAAGISLALFPLAVTADQTLLLEPYLVCFCLLGVVALFRGGELASSRRILLGGLAIGFAGTIKLWAVLPAAAALLVCLPAWRRGLRPLVIGLFLGFAVPCLPYFVFAPHTFLHDVITAQIHRGTSGRGALSIAQRLVMMNGLSGLPGLNATTGLALGLFIVLAVIAAVVYITTWRSRSRLEWFILLAVVIVMLGMFSSPEFYDHYAYFPAAFLALLLAVCVAQLVLWARQWADHLPGAHKRTLAIISSAVMIGVAGAVALIVQQDASYAAYYLASSEDPAASVAFEIPQGSCVVADDTNFGLTANRFNPSQTGCPAIVDPFGMFLTRDNGQPPPTAPPYPAAFPAAWQQWFAQSDYVVLAVPFSDYIPWTPQLAAYFDKHFRLVSSQPHVYIYSHFDRSLAGAAQSLVKENASSFATTKNETMREQTRSAGSQLTKPGASSIQRRGGRLSTGSSPADISTRAGSLP